MTVKRERIITTISPYYLRLVKGESLRNGEGKSSVIANIVKQHYDTLTLEERKELIKELD